MAKKEKEENLALFIATDNVRVTGGDQGDIVKISFSWAESVREDLNGGQ
jgi:hypothetical protein